MIRPPPRSSLFPYIFLLLFFFNDTATTEIYTLSLHDALPISRVPAPRHTSDRPAPSPAKKPNAPSSNPPPVTVTWRHSRESAQSHRTPCSPPSGSPSHRSEEHTSELQSLTNLVCRLLLEKKNGGYDLARGQGTVRCRRRGRHADWCRFQGARPAFAAQDRRADGPRTRAGADRASAGGRRPRAGLRLLSRFHLIRRQPASRCRHLQGRCPRVDRQLHGPRREPPRLDQHGR